MMGKMIGMVPVKGFVNRHEPDKTHSCPVAEAIAVSMDEDGILWAATVYGGLYRLGQRDKVTPEWFTLDTI